MPRLTRSQPAYRLYKASGQAIVKFFDNRGYDLGKHGSPESRAEYDRLIALWLTNGRRLETMPGLGDLTVSELIVRY